MHQSFNGGRHSTTLCSILLSLAQLNQTSICASPKHAYARHEAGFDASWEIDLFGGKRRAIEAARADIDAAVENQRDVLITLLAEVARNYIEVRGSQRRWAIVRKNIKVQQETVEITRARYKAGLSGELDAVQAEALLATTQSQIPLLEAVNANRRAVGLASELFTGGLVNFLNVLDAERSLYRSEDELVQSERTVSLNLVILYKALGGGWETEPS